MSTYVLDASAGADLLLDTVVARSLQPQFVPGSQWWVPEHYFVEVAAVIRRAEALGVITAGAASAAMRGLRTAPVHRVQVRPLLDAAWSRRGHLTMYDALYIVLAEHLSATLVTSDLRLANSLGLRVPVIVPYPPMIGTRIGDSVHRREPPRAPMTGGA